MTRAQELAASVFALGFAGVCGWRGHQTGDWLLREAVPLITVGLVVVSALRDRNSDAPTTKSVAALALAMLGVVSARESVTMIANSLDGIGSEMSNTTSALEDANAAATDAKAELGNIAVQIEDVSDRVQLVGDELSFRR